ncbi:N-acetyltransferase family protein [Altererythrobacter sp. MF3-039]|uniref:GNAT family N-acetyltransferase n=1 Tax=Altererythrobacter sp. MF3-039 TaxID=3252901 RepID=UPI00390CC40C
MIQNVTLKGVEFELRELTAADRNTVLAFAAALPAHDLLFLRRDITQTKVVEAWIAATEAGAFTTLLAEHEGAVVGCIALYTDPLSWSPHVGELRVLVADEVRKHGLGRWLVEQGFRIALDKGLSKLTAQMTIDQKAAITVFEELGFRGEALLKDQVRDADGKMHDLVVLACDVANASARIEAYGIGESA